MSQKIINGDSAEVLKTIESNTIDAVITDPPYGIEFLGKEWDKNTGAIEIWRECFRVLKPGGFLLAFSAARTYHHLATNIESVGFDIRDQIMWIYASGFPKAQDIGKSIQRRQGVEEYEGFVDTTKNAGFGQTDHARVRAGVEWSTKATQVGKAKCTSPEAQQWSGWKTALKPAHEPIVMARKPMKGSTIDNVLTHGVGALNIDATRIAFEDKDTRSGGANGVSRLTFGEGETSNADSFRPYTPNEQGRYPSNVLGDIADYQKYFYCPKVTRKERHKGFEQDKDVGNNAVGKIETEDKKGNGLDRVCETCGTPQLRPDQCVCVEKSWVRPIKTGNNHPTVKPVALMKYLVRLVTPQGSHIIDPFSGSGSTGMACRELGRTYTGIDLDPRYCEIARKRIAASQEDLSETLFE
jgi:DNA modification methylase